jgi:SAM-dependent methyltransferase
MDRSRHYIHGYDGRESERLSAQASSVLDLLHGDTTYSAGSRVLEVGCGPGAQTVTLARNSPDAHIVAFDRSAISLAQAKARLASAGIANVDILHADLFELPFAPESFDHVFVCFVLEHLPQPVDALVLLRHLLRPGGTITLFEGDHGSAYFHPHSAAAHRAIDCQVELQRRAGGNACIGRQLYPLLATAGYQDAQVSPRMVYVDATRPWLVDSFTRTTFTWMVKSVRTQALQAGIIDAATFDAGIDDLERAAQPDGVFCYTFFKGFGVKQPPRPGRA